MSWEIGKVYLALELHYDFEVGFKFAKITEITERYVKANIFEKYHLVEHKFSKMTGKEFRPNMVYYKLTPINKDDLTDNRKRIKKCKTYSSII